ncbi:MAG: choice-of-anchor D domain-containing protein, partial [Terracidiphilus sp.]
AAVPTLTLSTATVSFGTVAVGATGTGSVTLTSSGTAAVTVSAGTVSGTGFTISGVSFPLTLIPGQTATLTVGFAPTAAGAVSGTVTLTSNSSTGTTSAITLSGTGQPVLSGLICTSGSMTGAGTDPCTATLNAAAGTGGQAVSVSSNATAVTVPSSVTVAAGATSASFSATVSAVSTAETATLAASSGGGTQTYAISLIVPVSTLSLQSTSVAFGDVNEGTPSYQLVTLTSSGTAAVTVSAGSVSGTGYSISGVSFPSTLNSGATATLDIEFDPTTAGVADGTVTLTSNSSTGTTSTISLTGTGVATSYEVNLTWDAPIDSSDPVTGYNIYRVVTGGSTYALVNPSVVSLTSYSDTSVANNTSYTYYVVSVDAEGNQSVPSTTFTVSVP